MDGDGPMWLGPLPAATGGVDFMGLRQPGLTMADTLLPGITNTTRSVRYYTAIATWFQYARGSRELRVQEAAFVHACREHAHEGRPPTGIVGVDAFRGVNEGRYATGLEPGRTPVSAMDAAFYGPSATALGVIGRTSTGHYARTPFGERLAAAGAVHAAPAESIDAGLVAAYGSLCPCTPAADDERILLEELLFRHEERAGSVGKADAARRATLALLLHLSTGPIDEGGLLQRMVDRLAGRIEEDIPLALRPAADGLGLLALRWHFRHAIESAWAAFGRLVFFERPFGARAAPYVEIVGECADGSYTLPSLTRGVSDVLASLPDVASAELRQHRAIKTSLNASPGACLLASATQLLAIGRLVAGVNRDRVAYAEFLDLSAPWWCPLSALPREIDPGATMAEWVRFVIDRYVVGQHLLTAARKLADGVDGYFFYAAEDGYRVDAARFADARRVRGSWRPDAGPTKLPSAFAMLRDIGLLEIDAERRVSRTARGRETLERVLSRTS